MKIFAVIFDSVAGVQQCVLATFVASAAASLRSLLLLVVVMVSVWFMNSIFFSILLDFAMRMVEIIYFEEEKKNEEHRV